MSFGQDSGGATLAFVTRVVEGPIFEDKTRFNEETQKNEKMQVPVENPVVVFFPNRTTQVFPLKRAEALGFMQQPSILNIEAVNDPNSAGGRFKFAMTEDMRREAWIELENFVISGCLAKGGMPLPQGCDFSKNSIFFEKPKKEKVA